MRKKEKDQNVQEPRRQEPEIQRKDLRDEIKKTPERMDEVPEQKAEDKKKQKAKVIALIGCCAALLIAIACLTTAINRPVQSGRETVETSTTVTPGLKEDPSKEPDIVITSEPKSTESTVTPTEKPEKEPLKDGTKDNSAEAEKKENSSHSQNSGNETGTQKPDDAGSVTGQPAEADPAVETGTPQAGDNHTPVQTPAVTAVPEAVPQETTTEITPEPTPLPHVHSWVTKFRTVHHAAVTEEVKVVDQAAYTEPVYEEQPVYETIAVYVCDVCGEDFENIGEHSDTHIDWETFTNPFHYHVDFRQGAQIGTEMVQTGSITHPEVSHMETRVVKAAYDEQVADGYVCTGCGAVK